MTRHAVLAALAVVAAGPLLAAPRLKPEKPTAPPLAGTSWAGKSAEGWDMTIDFAADGKMTGHAHAVVAEPGAERRAVGGGGSAAARRRSIRLPRRWDAVGPRAARGRPS